MAFLYFSSRPALQYERVGAPKYARAALVLDRVAECARREGSLDGGELPRRPGEARAICEAARLIAYRLPTASSTSEPGNGPSPMRISHLPPRSGRSALSPASPSRSWAARQSAVGVLCVRRYVPPDRDCDCATPCPQHAIGACPEDSQTQNATVT
jgi:hypothetical protein